MSELPAERARLAQLWEEHMRHEFQTCSTEDTLATMVEDAYVNHVPVMTGGVGHAELRQFYATHFIPKMPPDMEMTPLSRTIGTDQLVDEMVVRFTHTIEMDWMLPGIAPTGKRVEVALVVIVHFPRRQACSRAHLLGPSLGAGAARADRYGEAAGLRRRYCPEGARPIAPGQHAHPPRRADVRRTRVGRKSMRRGNSRAPGIT
jgi:hypothetical protein